jgi:glycosyltransferase involved in cell wall biosynthesis
MNRLRVGVPLIQSELSGGSWIAGLYYVRSCLNALALLPPQDVPTIVAFLPDSYAEPLLFPEHGKPSWLVEARIPADVVRFDASKLQECFDHYRCDVFFPVTSLPKVRYAGPAIGWVPDFQHRHHPQFFGHEEYATRELFYSFLVSHCDRIACSSRAVQADLSAFYPDLRDKAVLLSFAVLFAEDTLRQSPRPTLEKLGITAPYVYLPNQFWVHKNHEVVFEAWKELAERGAASLLVCSGQTDDYRLPGYMKRLEAFLDQHALRPKVRLLGHVAREDQVQLFRGASLVLQPSLFEGWSTTIEEAKSLGKPLVVSDIPVHREQCAEGALYFRKDDPADLATALERASASAPPGHDPERESRALAAARGRAQAFARELVAACRDAVDAHRRSPYSGVEKHVGMGLLVDLTRRLEDVTRSLEDLTRSLEDLTRRLEQSEADRVARGELLDRQAARLAASEADGAARLDVIERMAARVRETRLVLEQARPSSFHGLATPFEVVRVRRLIEQSLLLMRDLAP